MRDRGSTPAILTSKTCSSVLHPISLTRSWVVPSTPARLVKVSEPLYQLIRDQKGKANAQRSYRCVQRRASGRTRYGECGRAVLLDFFYSVRSGDAGDSVCESALIGGGGKRGRRRMRGRGGDSIRLRERLLGGEDGGIIGYFDVHARDDVGIFIVHQVV